MEMRLAAALICATIMSVGPALASNETEIVARIQQAVNACNRNDVAAFKRYLTPSPVAMDEVPPYHFQGAHALSDWENAYSADSSKNAITDPVITLRKATDIEVSGTHAYVVWPATYSYKQAGQPSQHNGIITFALEK